jgi:hypothetical protein
MHLILSFIKFQRLLLEEKLSPQVTDEVLMRLITPHPPLTRSPFPSRGRLIFLPNKQSGREGDSLPANNRGEKYSLLSSPITGRDKSRSTERGS